MEHYLSAQTRLISAGTMPSNFEWSQSDTQLTLQNFNDNKILYDYNSNCSFISASTTNPINMPDTNSVGDLTDSNFELDFNLFDYLNADFSAQATEIQDKGTDEIYKLEIDDSFKNVLNEIETISSGFINGETLSRSPSESSLLDQIIMSPPVNNDGECPTSSNESQFNEDAKLKKVKSGKISKKESNKNAALRYRVKKTRERYLLFQECNLYQRKNKELKDKINAAEQEIGFIKNLLIQAINTKK